MVTKGIVEKIIDTYTVKVRMPIFDAIKEAKNGVKTEDLSTAIICTLPNSSNVVSVNDVVFVAFEDDDYSKPIIIGHLFREALTDTKLNVNFGTLTTSSTTRLNKDTYIGEVRPNEIQALLGVKENIQNQLDDLYEKLESIIESLGD